MDPKILRLLKNIFSLGKSANRFSKMPFIILILITIFIIFITFHPIRCNLDWEGDNYKEYFEEIDSIPSPE